MTRAGYQVSPEEGGYSTKNDLAPLKLINPVIKKICPSRVMAVAAILNPLVPKVVFLLVT
jgi:hypothetical protein